MSLVLSHSLSLFLSACLCEVLKRARLSAYAACLCMCSPLRRGDNNCKATTTTSPEAAATAKTIHNYILIQNAHLPHFNFHTLTCASVLYLPEYEQESEREQQITIRFSLLTASQNCYSLTIACSLARSLRFGCSAALLLVLLTQIGARACSLAPSLSSFSIVSRSSCHFLVAIIVACWLKKKQKKKL